MFFCVRDDLSGVPRTFCTSLANWRCFSLVSACRDKLIFDVEAESPAGLVDTRVFDDKI